MPRLTPTARHGAGTLSGALSGYLDQPAIGCPPLQGWSLHDDFIMEPHTVAATTEVGDWGWTFTSVGGPGASAAAITPTAITEKGICRFTTAAVLNEIATSGEAVPDHFAVPAIGASFAVKMRLHTLTWTLAASGWVETLGRIDAAAPANSFLGFRGDVGAGAANWYFVSRAAAVETTVDMGVAADGTWRIFGARCLMDATWQAYLIDCSNIHQGPVWTPVGTPIPVASLPVTVMRAMIFQVCNRVGGVGTEKQADIDFVAYGGRGAR
jgi:hypothetical protein